MAKRNSPIKLDPASVVVYTFDNRGGRGKRKIVHATMAGYNFVGYGPHEKAAIRSLRDQIRNGPRAFI